jgi:hypothetical protein
MNFDKLTITDGWANKWSGDFTEPKRNYSDEEVWLMMWQAALMAPCKLTSSVSAYADSGLLSFKSRFRKQEETK